MNENALINDLTTGSVAKKLIIFSLPFMASTVLQTLYSMVDMIIVGHFVGSDGLSAVSTVSGIVQFITSMAMGFSTSGQILISQLVGANEHHRIKYAVGTLFTSLFALAVVIMLAGFALCDGVLNLVNTPAEALAGARQYLLISFGGAVFIYGYNAVSSILRGMGDSKHPLMFIAIASVMNLVLDLLFVAVFHMGVAGAALATVMGQAVSFLWALFFLYRRREQFHFDFRPRSFIPERRSLIVVLKVGFPLALQGCAIDVSMVFVNSFVNSYGLAASAAYGVGAKVERIPSIATHALWSAGAAMVGQNVGAGRYDRAKKTVYVSLAICATVCSIAALLYWLIPEQLFGLFTDDPAILALAWTYLLTSIINQPAAMLSTPYCAVIEGTGNAALSLAIGIIDGIFARIALSYLLGQVLGYGLFGFFLGNNLAMYFTAIPAVIYFYSGLWTKRKLLID